MAIRNLFSGISRKAAEITGTWQASILAIASVIIWTIGGFFFGFSDTYQLIINTGTTIVTFIMVFLIQGAQNHDTKAMHIKLDELLCSIAEANNQLIDIEKDTDEQLEKARQQVGSNKERSRP